MRLAPYPTALLRDVCDSVDYGYTASASSESVGPRFLRITDIVPDRLDWASVPFCEIDAKKHAKHRLRTGDIVIARTGATTGWARYISDPPDAVFASYLVRIRPSPAVDARYVGFVLESAVYKEFVQQHMGGAAQPNANAQVLTSFTIPLPPLREHANRVFPGKHSGVIVDYANVFASLEKALAIYGAGKGGANPVKDKAELVAALRAALEAATAFCGSRGVSLAAIEALPLGGLERLSALEDAINALIAPESMRRDFFGHERLVATLYGAVKPDPAALEFAERVAGIVTLGAAIRAKLSPNPPDITAILGQIAGLLDQSILGQTIREGGPPAIDLSRINFEALAERFKASTHKNTDLEALKAAVLAKLNALVRLNRTRADFREKFEALIESYNAGSRNIEQLFEELLKLSNSLDDEQERHVRENLSEEELVIFDIFTRPAPELSTNERAEVKKVARDLLTRLKALLVPSWRQRVGARSAMQMAIDEALDAGLPRAYAPDVYRQKCVAVFEHVYESYPERDTSVYRATQ